MTAMRKSSRKPCYANPTTPELRSMVRDEQRLFLCRHGYVGSIHAIFRRNMGACETHAAWIMTANRDAPRMGVLVVCRQPMASARSYIRKKA